VSLPTREIDEIVQLHVREHARLQEVFVEGAEDKRFYETFLAEHGLASVAVLEVGTVFVPDGEIVRIGLALGKKGRVITLAALLSGRVARNEVVCIADADLDHFKEVRYPYPLLILTDYSSVELYVFCPPVMRRVLHVGLKGFPKNAEQVIKELSDLLQESFLVRVAADALRLAPDYPDDHSSFCAFDKHKAVASFRAREYISKAFERYTDRSWCLRLENMIRKKREQLKSDARMQIHGHDLARTFAWYIRQHKGYGHLNPKTLADLFLGFVDSGTLAQEPLFRELLLRLNPAVQRTGAGEQ